MIMNKACIVLSTVNWRKALTLTITDIFISYFRWLNHVHFIGRQYQRINRPNTLMLRKKIFLDRFQFRNK